MNDLTFGHTWEDIQGMQQKKAVRQTIDCSKPSPVYDHLPCGTRESDIQLMCEIGIEGLEREEKYGILDRLARSGVIKWEYKGNPKLDTI